jgi:hypothetical protein
MKTIKEWIDTLPQDIKERAYKRIENCKLTLSKDTFYDALLCSFVWDETYERHKFWSLVAKGEFDEARQLLINKTNKTKP